jgi:hypothetical protein
MGSAAFTALVVPAIFVAFVTFAAFAGLATARRFADVVLRSPGRAILLRAASAFWALAVFFFRISTVVVFLWFKFLRAAALLFEFSARVVVAPFAALLPPPLWAAPVRPPAGREAAAFRRAEVVATLANVRFVCGRAAAAAGFRPDLPFVDLPLVDLALVDLALVDLALVRAPAPAFDFFELFLTDAIRTSLLPGSARWAEHATGDATHSVALHTVSGRQSPAPSVLPTAH